MSPYGFAESPITPDFITAKSVRLGDIVLDGHYAYWTEGRTEEKRTTIVMKDLHSDAPAQGILPPKQGVGSRVHEYGGLAFAVHQGQVWFVNGKTQDIYTFKVGDEKAQRITRLPAWRFADLRYDAVHQRLLAVGERHALDEQGESLHQPPENMLVAINLGVADKRDEAALITLLHQGDDFYANPEQCPVTGRIAFLTWNHPQLPWDGSKLYVADVDAKGAISAVSLIAGGATESIFQPQWQGQQLLFMSDRSGWWNPYCYDGDIQPIADDEDVLRAEHAWPQWVFGMSTWSPATDNTFYKCVQKNGAWQLRKQQTGVASVAIDVPEFSYFEGLRANALGCVFKAGGTQRAMGLYFLPLDASVTDADSSALVTLASASQLTVEAQYLAKPRWVSYDVDGDTVHAVFYPPAKASALAAEEGNLPPLLVKCHGGPTASTDTVLNWKIHYWTSRGFAVLDVNYRGSTGYGREYRQKLYGQWGVVDVKDCARGAEWLIEQQLVNPKGVYISGSSAGGFTVLRALLDYDVFNAGACYYGISDLVALGEDTHKFELSYNDHLLGSLPEALPILQQRSPINQAEQLAKPVVFFQGGQDKVVMPEQSEKMYQALQAQGVYTEYHLYPEEGHGFRDSATVQHTLATELAFFQGLLNEDRQHGK